MAYNADYVASPKYGDIRIGEMVYFGDSANVRDGYYPQTTFTPTILLYDDILPNLNDKQPIFDSVWLSFINHQFLSMEEVVEALESDDYHKIVTDIEWLWGAPDVGGVGVCKSGPDSYQLITLNGYVFDNEVYQPNAGNISISYPHGILLGDQTPSDLDPRSPQNLSIPPEGRYKTGIFLMTYGNYDSENNSVLYNHPELWINACAVVTSANDSYTSVNPSTGLTQLATATFTDAGLHIQESWRHQFYNSLPASADFHPIWRMRKEEQWSFNALYPYWASVWLEGPGAPNVENTSIFGGDSVTIDPEGNPYETIDNGYGPGGGGGGGPQNRYSEDTLPEGVPSLTLLNSGFVKLYNPTLAEVNAFSSFLFSGITEDMSAVIKRMMANPIDYILALNMIHIPLTTNRTPEVIGFCGISSGVSSKVVTQQYYQIEYQINIEEFWRTALDYSSYTRCKIYVPYCGIYDLNIDEIQNGTLWLRYVVDVVSGSVVAFVGTRRKQKDGTWLRATLAQYNGNCILAMPVSSTNWQNTFSSILNIANMAIAPSPTSVAGMAQDIMSQKVSVQKSGSISANFGYLGKQTPYVILERPELSIPVDYGHHEGYPANHKHKLSEVHGYTEIKENTLIYNKFSGTDEEMEMLKSILENGVYLD